MGPLSDAPYVVWLESRTRRTIDMGHNQKLTRVDWWRIDLCVCEQ